MLVLLHYEPLTSSMLLLPPLPAPLPLLLLLCCHQHHCYCYCTATATTTTTANTASSAFNDDTYACRHVD